VVSLEFVSYFVSKFRIPGIYTNQQPPSSRILNYLTYQFGWELPLVVGVVVMDVMVMGDGVPLSYVIIT